MIHNIFKLFKSKRRSSTLTDSERYQLDKPVSDTHIIRIPKKCDHDTCQLTSKDTCCECGDARPFSSAYDKYVDGVGWIKSAKRYEHYCPGCVERLKSQDRQSHKNNISNTNNDNKQKKKNNNNNNIVNYHDNIFAQPIEEISHPYCPHSTVPTDCRICDEDQMIEERALKDVMAMGFKFADIIKAMETVKNNGLRTKDPKRIVEAILLILVDNGSDHHQVHQQQQNESHHNMKHEKNQKLENQGASADHVPSSPILHNAYTVTPSAPPLESHYNNPIVYAPSAPPSISSAVSSSNSKLKDEIDDDNACKICFEVQINTVLIPCGHLALCMSCATSVVHSSSKSCPICRTHVTNVVQTFKA